MKYTINTFDFEENAGKKLWIVEEVDVKEELGKGEFYVCENEEKAKELCDKMNNINTDKRFKFIYYLTNCTETGFEC